MTKVEPPLDLDPDGSEVDQGEVAMNWAVVIGLIAGAAFVVGCAYCAHLKGWI